MRPTSREAKGPCTGVIYGPHQNETKGKNKKNTNNAQHRQNNDWTFSKKVQRNPCWKSIFRTRLPLYKDKRSGQTSPSIKTSGLWAPPVTQWMPIGSYDLMRQYSTECYITEYISLYMIHLTAPNWYSGYWLHCKTVHLLCRKTQPSQTLLCPERTVFLQQVGEK